MDAGAIVADEFDEIAGLLFRVNAVVFLFKIFVSEDTNPAILVLGFTLLSQIKVVLKTGYFEKPALEKVLRGAANFVAGLTVMCLAAHTGEISLSSMFDQPNLSEARWFYKFYISLVWYTTISANASILMKIVFLAVELV